MERDEVCECDEFQKILSQRNLAIIISTCGSFLKQYMRVLLTRQVKLVSPPSRSKWWCILPTLSHAVDRNLMPHVSAKIQYKYSSFLRPDISSSYNPKCQLLPLPFSIHIYFVPCECANQSSHKRLVYIHDLRTRNVSINEPLHPADDHKPNSPNDAAKA